MGDWFGDLARQSPFVVLLMVVGWWVFRYVTRQHVRELAAKQGEIDRLLAEREREVERLLAEKQKEIDRILRERKPFLEMA